jgi:hypothetical protein
MAAAARWKSAQEVSKCRQERSMAKASLALVAVPDSRAEVLSDASESDEEAMMEVAQVVGAADARSMAAVGQEGLCLPPAARGVAARPVPPGASSQARGAVDAILDQLRKEPADEGECMAKFALYEGYGSEVEQMRGTLFKFHEENRAQLPAAVSGDMDAQVRAIDTQESMGIPDRCREWFVFHMMRQAERNNLKMAGILDGFEKKLEFLAANDQVECPVCLEAFDTPGGARAPETLSCCHKVCKDCWDSWSSVMRGRPFCPLCRHEEFLGAVASQVSGGL